MKNLLLFAIAFLMHPFLHADSTGLSPDERCRQLAEGSYDQLSARERIKTDLLSGTWSKEDMLNPLKGRQTSSDKGTVFQFNNYGLLDHIYRNSDGNFSMQTFSWDVVLFGDVPFLSLQSGDSYQAELFKIDQTCEGIRLTNIATNEATNLTYEKRADEASQNAIRFAMTGKWECAAYPFNLTNDLNQCGTFEAMNGAFLEYEFSADGTYVRRLGTKHLEIEEQGIWEISENGKFLLFHVGLASNPEKISTTRVAEISHLNPGEMVMKQSLQTLGEFNTLFCTDSKTFFFNKL